jgi:hypothetical protein
LFQREDLRPDDEGWANGAVPVHPTITYIADLSGLDYVSINDLYPNSGLDHGYVLKHIVDDNKSGNVLATRNTSRRQATEIINKALFLFSKGVEPKDILVICPYDSNFYFWNLILIFRHEINGCFRNN